jgi:hypothetical protein
VNRKRLAKGGWAVAALSVSALAFNTFSAVPAANATHQPADKVVASGKKIETTGLGEVDTLLTATLRSSSPSDLILSVAMECSIITDNVITGGSDVSTETSDSRAKVRIWVEIDGKIVPVNSVSTGTTSSTPAAGEDSDKVTFCNRIFTRTVTDKEDPLDGIDYSRDYIETKDANAFNWLRLNMGSGIHTIAVKAEFSASATAGSMAKAYIGNRSLIVQPAKLANDASI